MQTVEPVEVYEPMAHGADYRMFGIVQDGNCKFRFDELRNIWLTRKVYKPKHGGNRYIILYGQKCRVFPRQMIEE